MKLRIRGNLLRFRLGRMEVQNLGTIGRIEETVHFGPDQQNDFCFALQKSPSHEFSGTFASGRITVTVPESIVNDWVDSDQVSIEGSQKLDEKTALKFLVEKDFVCLNAHNDEDQTDRYPHPKGEEAC